jgi:hypothetical protein
MKRIKITERQYQNLLSHINENRQTINEGEDVIKSDLNVLLMVSNLLGLSLTGLNKIKLENALKSLSVYEQVKFTLESKEKLEELIESLEIKGMSEPKRKLKEKLSTIISKFNTLSSENGFDVKLSPKAMTNLNSLDVD